MLGKEIVVGVTFLRYSGKHMTYCLWECFRRGERLQVYNVRRQTVLVVNYPLLRIRGVVANYFASQARDPGINSHQHRNDSWHIWPHLRKDTVFSCNLRCLLIFLHGCSRTYHVASLRAGPVGRISYSLYFDCKHVRYVTCDLINKYNFFFEKKYFQISSLNHGLCNFKAWLLRSDFISHWKKTEASNSSFRVSILYVSINSPLLWSREYDNDNITIYKACTSRNVASKSEPNIILIFSTFLHMLVYATVVLVSFHIFEICLSL